MKSNWLLVAIAAAVAILTAPVPLAIFDRLATPAHMGATCATGNGRIGVGLIEGMNRAEILVVVAIVATGSTVIGMWTLPSLL
jgi:hypothetical protein